MRETVHGTKKALLWEFVHTYGVCHGRMGLSHGQNAIDDDVGAVHSMTDICRVQYSIAQRKIPTKQHFGSG